ncbi:cobalt ABC transporter permease [Coralliovum pocilloporae]|uniref:cobalt ABC transporter permease n=1 Tax=Coralliovum pocilloporae TaxID=3066369 RepID=UPI003307694C
MTLFQFFARLALVACFSLSMLTPALAHKVIIGLYAEGDHIEGEVGFSNGDMAKNVLVEVFDSSGKKLGETKTDDEGIFIFKPTIRIDHVFTSNLGQGHVANGTLTVDEMPESLKAGSTPQQQASTTSGPATTETGEPNNSASAAVNKEELEAAIAKAVAKGVRPLRKELQSFQDKLDLQRVLGGIGYIVGLFGVGFYLAARRKLADQNSGKA